MQMLLRVFVPVKYGYQKGKEKKDFMKEVSRYKGEGGS